MTPDGASAGWSLIDVSRYVAVVGGVPFAVVFDGPLDEATLAERLGPGDGGVWQATETGTSIAHRSGRTGVFVEDAQLRDWADGSGSTLADDDTFAALGRGLDTQDVYGAVVYDGLGGFDDDDVCLSPFEGLAVGMSIDDDGAVVVAIVDAHTDAAAAADNAATLEDWLVREEAGERYRELSPEPIEVMLDDDVVTVVFIDPEVGPLLGDQLVQRFDPLVMHRPD